MKRGEIWTVAGGAAYAGKPRPAVIALNRALFVFLGLSESEREASYRTRLSLAVARSNSVRLFSV